MINLSLKQKLKETNFLISLSLLNSNLICTNETNYVTFETWILLKCELFLKFTYTFHKMFFKKLKICVYNHNIKYFELEI